MKQISLLILCFAMSGSLYAAVTLTDLRNAIEGGDSAKFMNLAETAIKEGQSDLLKSTFPYTIRMSEESDWAAPTPLNQTQNLTLLMLAVMRQNDSIVEYMVKKHPDKFAVNKLAWFSREIPTKDRSLTALQVAEEMLGPSSYELWGWIANKNALIRIHELLIPDQPTTVTIKNLQDAIEYGWTDKFKKFVEKVKKDGKDALLQTKFSYTLDTINDSGKSRPVVSENFTLLALAILRKNADIVTYMVTKYPTSFDVSYEMKLTYMVFDEKITITTLNALQLAQGLLNGKVEGKIASWVIEKKLDPKEKKALDQIIDILKKAGTK